MNKNQLDGLLALKLVAEKESFTAAAEELKVSPPAVSKMITELEKRMGITLLTRTTRTVRLSQAGDTFLEQAGPAIDQILGAQKNAQNFAEKPSGTLKLNMPGIFYPHYLMPHIKTFLKKHPDVTVDIYSDDQAQDIFASGFDAGVRTDDILAKDLIALKLFGPIKFYTAASPEYLKSAPPLTHPKDLLNHNCIRHRFGEGSVYEKWEFQEKSKPFKVNIGGNLVLNNSFNIRQAALSGEGVIYTEQGNIAEDVKSGRLKIVLEKFSTECSGYYLYYPHKKHISPTLRALIEHLKESKKEETGA